jgi:NDP-sugar pyrophosphorylase family protein
MGNPLSDLTALVLAGGKGTRLRGAIDGPKALATIRGKPFLFYLLDRLAESGFRKAVLCTGYLSDVIREVVGTQYREIEITHSIEKQPLGTAGALKHALPSITSETVLVLNGDSFHRGDFFSFYEWHCAKQSQASLLLVPSAECSRFGQVETDEDGRVAAFSPSRQGPGWINAGSYFFSRSFIEGFPKTCYSLEQEIFPRYANNGLYGHQSQSDFIDIGTPSAWQQAQVFFS